jgi:protein arginine kinase activator
MICELCKEHEATVHLTQVIDGSIKKLHLCEECAAKSGIDVHGPISITDILLGMGIKPKESDLVEAGAAAGPAAERVCPKCHMRRTDFKKTGRFGCDACYEAFADELPPLLKAMHRSEQHVGKVPAEQSVRVRAVTELASLEQALKKAIDAEQFEEAARIRDQILAWRGRIEQEKKP